MHNRITRVKFRVIEYPLVRKNDRLLITNKAINYKSVSYVGYVP